MKRFALTAVLLLLSLGAAPAAPPDTLALPDLVNRPDRWPPAVVLQRDFRFTNGTVLHQGDKAHLISFDGAHAVLIGAGNTKFAVAPADCALLDGANQAWSALTPAQRTLDPAALAADISLWPAQITTNAMISSKWGKLPADSKVGIANITARGTDIIWPKSYNTVTIDFGASDVFDQARQLVLLDRDKRSSPIAAALQNILVDADGKPVHDDRLQGAQYFAFYFGANWCQPCHAFSPDLVSFANDQGPKHPEMAIVFLSKDKDVPEMLTYMKEANMPFPASARKDWSQFPVLNKYSAEIIPQFTIVDRFGKIVVSNDDFHGNRADLKDTIAQLTKLLTPAIQ